MPSVKNDSFNCMQKTSNGSGRFPFMRAPSAPNGRGGVLVLYCIVFICNVYRHTAPLQTQSSKVVESSTCHNVPPVNTSLATRDTFVYLVIYLSLTGCDFPAKRLLSTECRCDCVSVPQAMPIGGGNVHCALCNVFVTSESCMPQHEQGKQHRKNTGTEFIIRDVSKVGRRLGQERKVYGCMLLGKHGVDPRVGSMVLEDLPHRMPRNAFFRITPLFVCFSSFACLFCYVCVCVLQVMMTGGNSVHCDVCNVDVPTAMHMPMHLHSKRHKKKTKTKILKQKASKCNLTGRILRV